MNTSKLTLVLVIVIVAIAMVFLGTANAQESKILMSTDQQYQNMAANADFETWNAGVTAVPDGWSLVSTPTVAQETTAPKLGSFSLKITTTNAGEGVSQPISVAKNTTYTISLYYKVASGSACTFSLTGTGSGAFTLSNAAALSSTTWARKSFTITTNATDTALTVKMVSDGTSNVFYLDGISVTVGREIPAFSRAVVADSGVQTIYGDVTIQGTTSLNGNVNLGDISTDNITLKGTLTSLDSTDLSVQSTTGILKLDKALKDNELRIFENSAIPASYTSFRHQNITTSIGNLTINPAGGATNITGILAATGNISAAKLSTDGSTYYDFGNASGNIPVSNGTLNTNLNADLLDGLNSDTSGATAHILATDVSGNIAIVNVDASGYLETGATPSTTGQIRMPNNTWISARNAAGTGNVNLISANASDRLAFGANVAGFTLAGNITGSSSPTISGFGTINGATLSGGTLSGGNYSGTGMTPNTVIAGDGVSYTLQPVINVTTPGITGYTALRVNVTETSAGSGTKNLADLAVGGVSKFVVDSTGQLTTGTIPGSKVSGNIGGDADNVTGIVDTTHGGTGADLSTGAQGGVTYMGGANKMAVSTVGTAGQVLKSNGTGAPTWTTDIAGNAANVTGTVLVAKGGTGLTTYTAGDIPYFTSGTALSKLGIGAGNKVLTSSGTAPQWSDSLTLAGALTVNGSASSSFAGNVGIGTAIPAAMLDVAKTYTTASALDYGAIIEPTYNVATVGANKYTALLIKSTEANLAGYSSTKLLLDLQAGVTPTSKFSVDNAGNITTAGKINNQTIGATSSLDVVNMSGDLNVGLGGYSGAGVTITSTGDVKANGNIYLKGAVYRENLQELMVKNNTIRLNYGGSSQNAFIQVEGTSGVILANIKWDNTNSRWEIDKPLNVTTGNTYKIAGTDVLTATSLGSTVVGSSLQSVGTISSGTWQGTAIAVNEGGTNITSYTTGDLVYASGATTLAKLADVATGSVLVSGGVGGNPTYSSSPTLSGSLTVQGVGNSSFAGKVGIGTANPSAQFDIVKSYTDTEGTVTQVAIQPGFAPTSGTAKLVGVNISPTINQTGTATGDYTALQVNATETLATGTNNLLADFQVGGATKAKIDSTGAMTIQGLTIGPIPLTSSTAGLEGATLVGTKPTGYTNFTPTTATVQGALAGIDTALGAISGGGGSFTNLVVTGTSDLQGAISNTTGTVTVADLFSQTGGGQVTFSGNVNTNNGVDVTGGNLTLDSNDIIVNTNKFTVDGLTGNTSSAGTVTAANGLTATTGGLTVSAGGASVTGGLNNNLGNIINAGSITGATTITVSGAITSLTSVCLIPEYDKATINGDGIDNFGTVSLKYGNSHNYYEWTTDEPTTQDYDIVIRYRLPDGFASFDAAPIKLWNKVSTLIGSTAVTVTMLHADGTEVQLNGGAVLKNTGWVESSITMVGNPVFIPGEYVTIIIKMFADQGQKVDIGELTMKGNW